MAIPVLELPYDLNALEPHISANAMEFHHRKHYTGYVNNVNKLISGSDLETATLEEIILASNESNNTALFNNAAQAWNHAFYWQCMRPDGGSSPEGDLLEAIKNSFGSLETFKENWKTACTGLFGSGWVWLVKGENGALSIEKGSNAETPLMKGQVALLTTDVWEHAYYLDYQNRRADFVQTFLQSLINWEFVSANFNQLQ